LLWRGCATGGQQRWPPFFLPKPSNGVGAGGALCFFADAIPAPFDMADGNRGILATRLEILLERWRDEMNGHLTRVHGSQATSKRPS
jgi:hypothetical protein